MKLPLNLLFCTTCLLLLQACGKSKVENTQLVESLPRIKETVTRTTIQAENAPRAIGPYSQAVQVGNTLYLSGQIAINPITGEMVTDDIEEETRQVMANLEAVLNAGGMGFEDVVKTTIFMQDLSNYGLVNEVYGSYFEQSPPARETVQVAALPKNAGLEISMIAVSGN